MKKIVFSEHAQLKFVILNKHGFPVSEDMVIAALRNPDIVEPGYKGRKIAQKIIDGRHVIRVVFEDLPETMLLSGKEEPL